MATNPYSEHYQQAAQSMMQAGIGSLSGNTINKPPLPDPRENYIRETHDFNSPTNVINRELQKSNALQKAYEGTGIVPQTFPNWVTQNPDASGMMNTWGRYNKGAGHSGSMFGTPRWMNATSYMDPTADDYFLREFGQYMKRFLPGYDQESDEFRQQEFRENQEENTTPDFIFQEDETGLPLPIMEAGMEENDLYHLMRNGYTLEEAQGLLNEQIGDGSFEMAKVYNNQMPGMIDEGYFWDSLTPESEAINKVLNMPGIEGMRQGSESDWNYDDYNKMIPDSLREQLPKDAFETLDDFRNQQPITII